MHYHMFMAVFQKNIHILDIRNEDKLMYLYDCMVWGYGGRDWPSSILKHNEEK